MSQANYSIETVVSSGIKVVTGKVSVTSNASSPDSGSRFEVGDFSSGKCEITLNDSYSTLLFAQASSIDNTTNYDNYFRIHEVNLGSNTITVACHDAGGNDVQPGTTEFSFLFLLVE